MYKGAREPATYNLLDEMETVGDTWWMENYFQFVDMMDRYKNRVMK